MVRKIIQNKHGWIRVVEAFVAVLILAGLILVFLDEGYIKKDDSSKEIYEIENSVLKVVQNNDSLRTFVLNASVPINSSDEEFPEKINSTINSKIPVFLVCYSKICAVGEVCLLDLGVEKNIYSKSVVISTDENLNFNPRKLVLFCYRR